ncbi:MAG: UDP-N-acetylmuramoyl-L-alanyl-D-glutamate--2,6-diaminopimelate ligase [Halanaerobiales bacterium]
MILRDLIRDLKSEKINGNLNKEVKDIVYDSRQVEEGSLFVCIEGFKVDGHSFIGKAIQSGAVAVIIEKEINEYHEGITYIKVADSREAMAYLSATFFDYPLKKLDLIGITGTNGKTTTTYLIRNMMENSGRETGLIGTIKNIIADKTLPATRTTPESLDLYSLYKKMLDAGLSKVVMEVSSHALDLKRVINMQFKVGIFTNITQDHLDYHKSLEDYLKAKSKLFEQIKPGGYAVVNVDDPRSDYIIEASRGEVISYAINKDADIKAVDIDLSPQGVSFRVEGKLNFIINMNLTGLFNVYNTLSAIGCGYALGLSIDEIKDGLEKVEGVAGRFELVDEGQGFSVIVDYAHTPDGMENALKTALEFVKGDIIVVFGCGGDRDKDKRPKMGKMAVRYGDYAILTSDNPRSEEPLNIIKDIEEGIKDSEIPYKIIPDRRDAIFYAIDKAEAEDMVIIFGKGHETYQIFKDKTISFDDREVAREALRSKNKGTETEGDK